jgi:hypothetical protein
VAFDAQAEVSSPWSKRKELNGERATAEIAQDLHTGFGMNAFAPSVVQKPVRDNESSGLLIIGEGVDCCPLEVSAITMTPPMEVPCPPMNFGG